ncbi:MAG: hypothetical protein DI539_12605 [Flavobacterium psychrophilum]|nr:MAG: hypothetical protein DI539_12605 [Flavobacterium psychrophilum]
MKKLLFVILIPFFAFSQEDFDKIPMKGKISTYTINRISGDSLQPKYEPVEKVVFDKQGRIISSSKHRNLGRGRVRSISTSVVNKLNVYKDNSLTNYKCNCEDINSFVQKFVIRNKEELKNQPRGGTPNQPTKFVKITLFDKNNNPISVSDYSESGYKKSEVKSTFTANKVTRMERYNFDDVIDETWIITYTKSGKSEEVRNKNIYGGDDKYIYVYDTDNNLLEIMGYTNGGLKEHTRFTIVYKDNYREFISHNILNDTKKTTKIIYYNNKKLETRHLVLNYNGEIQTRKDYTYDDNGVLESETVYYNDKDIPSVKLEYKLDKKGNWIELKKTELLYIQNKDTTIPQFDVTKYIRNIEYLK